MNKREGLKEAQRRKTERMQHLCECGHAKSEHGDSVCVHYSPGKPGSGRGEFCTCLDYRAKGAR